MEYLLKNGDKMFEKNTSRSKIKVVSWKSGYISVDIMRRDDTVWSGIGTGLTQSQAKTLIRLLQQATGGDR